MLGMWNKHARQSNHSIINLINKKLESFDEEFIKDRLQVISSAHKEHRKIKAEKQKKEKIITLGERKLQLKLQALMEKEKKIIEGEKEKEKKRMALEENKLMLEIEDRDNCEEYFYIQFKQL